MACAEQLQAFIQSKKQTKDADCIIFRIAVDQKFWVYRLLSRGEKVTIEQQCIQYHNQQMEISDLQEYDATEFCYTQEGYLFIEGYWVSNSDVGVACGTGRGTYCVSCGSIRCGV